MRNQHLSGLVIVAFVALSGCEESDIEQIRDQIRDPTNDNLVLAAAAAAPVTPVAALPTSGSANYDGVLAGTVAGDFVGSMYANLAMSIDFGSGDVTGEVSNADLLDDFGNIVQNLDGTLDVDGENADGVVTAQATGTLSGASGGLVSGSTVADFDLSGTVRTDVTDADTVYGTVTGGTVGDFDLDLSNGEFSGTTD
jgi:hypothetical protein